MNGPRDERWLALQVGQAETLDEAKLAVSVFLAARRNARSEVRRPYLLIDNTGTPGNLKQQA
jgi:hypothetical protein